MRTPASRGSDFFTGWRHAAFTSLRGRCKAPCYPGSEISVTSHHLLVEDNHEAAVAHGVRKTFHLVVKGAMMSTWPPVTQRHYPGNGLYPTPHSALGLFRVTS